VAKSRQIISSEARLMATGRCLRTEFRPSWSWLARNERPPSGGRNVLLTYCPTEPKATRDQARRDAERARDAIDRVGPSITPEAPKMSARTARKRVRTAAAATRCDHLRPLAQGLEVKQKEVRITGSISPHRRTLVAAANARNGFPKIRIDRLSSRKTTRKLEESRVYALRSKDFERLSCAASNIWPVCPRIPVEPHA
jgi:hypothetical protein